MSKVEFCLSPQECEAVVESVYTLRLIRGYISPDPLFYIDYTPDYEEAFSYSKKVQEALSGYLVAATFGEDIKTTRKAWEQMIGKADQRYQNFQPAANYNSDPKVVSAYVINDILQFFAHDDYRGIQEWVLEPNGLGNLTVEDLAESLLVVVAPLSTDYLAAGVLRECVRKKFSDLYGGTFNLYPAVFNDGLDEVILPQVLQNPQFYENQAGVLVLTDNPSTGKTLNGVCRAVRHVCPDPSKILNEL